MVCKNCNLSHECVIKVSFAKCNYTVITLLRQLRALLIKQLELQQKILIHLIWEKKCLSLIWAFSAIFQMLIWFFCCSYGGILSYLLEHFHQIWIRTRNDYKNEKNEKKWKSWSRSSFRDTELKYFLIYFNYYYYRLHNNNNHNNVALKRENGIGEH